MRNLKLKGIVVVTALTIMLTGCTTTNQTINKENNNSSVTQETIYEDIFIIHSISGVSLVKADGKI